MEVHDEVDDVVKLLEGKGYAVAWGGRRAAGGDGAVQRVCAARGVGRSGREAAGQL